MRRLLSPCIVTLCWFALGFSPAAFPQASLQSDLHGSSPSGGGAPPTEPSQAANDRRPNFVFVVADDMYPHMFNNLPEGRGKNLTPHLDRLASQGSFLTNAYVASPVCTPSRYGVLTGNFASRASNREFVDFTEKNEGQTVIQFNSFITPGRERTLGTHLQELGYKTGFVGKNHVIESLSQVGGSENNTLDLEADPRDDRVRALLERRHAALQDDIRRSGFDFADSLYHNNPNWLGVRALAHQNMDWVTEGGLRFLDEFGSGPEPFFLYFATTLPHQPTDPEHSWKSDPRITAKGYLDQAPAVQPPRDTLPTRVAAAGLEGTGRENLLWFDDALGALLEKLSSLERLDNTIILFFNDHGQHQKGTLYQGGIRTQAFVWRSQPFACGRVCDVSVSNTDFLATVLDMAGRPDSARVGDGYSFYPALQGEEQPARDSYFFELGYARAVIQGRYKYLALRYPQYAQGMNLEQREQLLQEYIELRESFGQSAISHDATLPFGHLEMVPGGGGAEHATYSSGKPGLFDPDQLYDLEADPSERHNLAKDPRYRSVLRDLRRELQRYLDDLPGQFKL